MSPEHPDPLRPALLVSATHSGAGKTTATSVLIHTLRDRGLTVQPFKAGPDFIDTAYHSDAAGRPAVNLDLWMMGEAGVRESFARWSAEADVSVIEGMGALYDGQDGTEHGSAAQLAKLLDVRVLVVLDVWGMTRTAGAILRGLIDFDPDVRVAGCLLNQVGSTPHARMVSDALPADLRPLVCGHIERRPALQIGERHLGLVTVQENADDAEARKAAYQHAAAGIDVDRLWAAAARSAATANAAYPPAGVAHSPSAVADPPGGFAHPPVGPSGRSIGFRGGHRPRLAVAADAAFCFYYRENLLLLEQAGVQIVEFSPLADARLPDRSDGVYLGGGYPESFAAELSSNTSMVAELRIRAADGMPIYAECGGLMYLAHSLTGFDGHTHPMAGVLDLDVTMDAEYLAIGYVEARTREDTLLGPAGTRIRGQEFHQSRMVGAGLEPNLFDVATSAGHTYRAGYRQHNVLASYLHLHLGSQPGVVEHLRENCFERRLSPGAPDPGLPAGSGGAARVLGHRSGADAGGMSQTRRQ